MTFVRIDGLDAFGNNQVTYLLVDAPGFDFSITATKAGLQVSGTTPFYTDSRNITQAFINAWAQYNSLSTQGVAIPEGRIVGSCLWPIG